MIREAERGATARSVIAKRMLKTIPHFRIQFRLPDGSSQTHHFPATSPLSELYDFVRTDLAIRWLYLAKFWG